MTWFRVGGAGIPATLKNAMNAVFNKKFGTSGQNYPPKQWPDDVNLLGPLPVKNASGAIASFSDGADDVPISSGSFSWKPKQAGSGTPSPTNVRTLSGYSGMKILQKGKNLWEFGDKTVDQVAYIMLYFDNPLPSGTYTISCELTSTTTSCSFRFRKEDGSALVGALFQANSGRVSQTLTLTEQAYRVYIYSSTQAGGETTNWKNVQIETGSTMTTFEAYKTKPPIVDDFGRTIYGGSRNTDGTLTETYARKIIDGTETGEDYLAGTNNNGNRVGFTLSDAETPKYSGCFSNVLENKECLNSATWTIGAFCVYGGKLYIVCPNEYTSYSACINYLISINAEIVYPITTPNEYQVDPISISSYLGSNNIYTDQQTGECSIDYRAAIDLALAALQGSRSLSASLIRSAGPEEVSELEENIQNNEEQEGDNDAR